MTITTITATELARNLSDVLNRVRYRGESFIVERNGEVVAELRPSAPPKAYNVADFRRDFAGARVPAGFADAIDEARKALGGLPEIQWR